MPQYTEPPCGGQVLDIDTAIKDGILDGGVPDGICSGRGGCGGGGGVGGGNEKPVDLRKLMEEVMENGDEEPVPAVFICPISLEPMVDPVTLCTGQTYERGNIGKWLSLGHRTCPTTMQELWDEALTPNATLRQLIAAWFSRRYARFKKRSADFHGRAADLVADLRRGLKGQARVAALKDLRSLLASHPSVAKPIADAGGVALLSSLLGPFTSHAVGSEAVAILVSGLPLDVDARTSLMQPAKVSLVVDMLNEGTVDTKINCVRLIHILVDDEKGSGFRAESLSLLAGLMRLVRDRRRPDGVAAGIGLLSSICAAHEPVRKMVISIGSVPQLVELLSSSNTTSPECLEAALEILESLSSVPEGQAALKDCPATIPNAVRLLMRVSEACTRRALTVLWAVCRMSPEECAPAAVEAGLAAKLLLVIQSGCAPDLKQQASELLKLCSLNYTATLFISKCKLTRTIQ